jgi:hypothetical protein
MTCGSFIEASNLISFSAFNRSFYFILSILTYRFLGEIYLLDGILFIISFSFTFVDSGKASFTYLILYDEVKFGHNVMLKNNKYNLIKKK